MGFHYLITDLLQEITEDQVVEEVTKIIQVQNLITKIKTIITIKEPYKIKIQLKIYYKQIKTVSNKCNSKVRFKDVKISLSVNVS